MHLVIRTIYDVVTAIILLGAIVTWVPSVARMPVGRLFTNLAKPLLAPFRRFIPPVRLGGGYGYVDLSPVACLLTVNVVFYVFMNIFSR